MLKPLADRVVIKRLEAEEKNTFAILLTIGVVVVNVLELSTLELPAGGGMPGMV